MDQNEQFPDCQELFQFIQKQHETILGIGCDLIEIDRIHETLLRLHDHFLCRIFTEKEIKLARELKDPTPFYAARFAAKEALSKALGTGIGKVLQWHDMEILKKPTGQPYVIWDQKIALQFSINHTYLSLSHSKTHAMAFCVITSNKK